MLVLSRRPGESIHIGSEITLTLIEIKGNRVRLGIQAPDDVTLLRSELVGVSVSASTPQLSLSARCPVH
jgi:carbon storage regulator CsrA